MPSVVMIPPEALPSANFSPEAATKAYLAHIPASAKARFDAYFEGGYWLILLDCLYGVVLSESRAAIEKTRISEILVRRHTSN